MTNFAFEARGLRKHFRAGFFFKRVDVLHGIDLELARGEFLGLVGPNGSGKSTLLRLVAGSEPASAGVLTVLGGTPGARGVQRHVGYLPEDSPYPRELTPRRVLHTLASLYEVPRSERATRAGTLLERVGLLGASDKRLGSFSRGMLRRFGLAAVLLHEPQLILLDEPTAGLDAQGFAVVDELLGEARARGAAAVIASHLWTDLQRHCQRTAVLIDGRIVAHGTPLELVGSLGASVQIDVTLANASEAALASVRASAERAGARVVGIAPSQANLLELYRRHGASREA